jgi:uncharacterized protein
MLQVLPHIIHQNTFLLSSDKCIFWEEEKILILSDIHFGKTGHFRKSGIPVPQNIFKEDMQRFVSLLQQFKPSNVIVIGDMFHSHDNKEHDFFLKWRKDFEQLSIQLVMGNHDILKREWYKNAGIQLIEDCHTINNICFVHDVSETALKANCFYFSGHIHPGISIASGARQSVHLPCFYFTEQYAVLPAFGKFTGTYLIRPKKGEVVFAIMPANHQRKEKGGVIKLF